MPMYPGMDIDITEEMMEVSDQKSQNAMDTLNKGNLNEAVNMFTEVIKLNPKMARLYAKRPSVYIHMKKLKAAIHDCSKAIGLNPDTTAPYKFRGKAKMMLGLWEDAYHDLTAALKLDYDDETYEMLKQVKPNALKIQAHRRRYELKREEKVRLKREEKARLKREEKARKVHKKGVQKARKKSLTHLSNVRKMCHLRDNSLKLFKGMDSHTSGEHGFAGGFPGSPGGSGMPDIGKLLQDPEIASDLQDPEVSNELRDIFQNPANIRKYQNNPKVQKIFNKLLKKLRTDAGSACDG